MPSNAKDYYYLRLSKEDGDVEAGSIEESCSISSQRECIQQYIRSTFSNELTFEEIVDDGFSGTNMHRPGMQHLLKQVVEGNVRTLIVRDLSRFARNYLEAGHYLEFVFPAYGIRFISINDRFDSAALGEETGGLELAIRNLINQMYSRDISRKIKSTVDMKKRSGEYVYGTAPYGYKKGKIKNTIVIDETVAPVVKQIFTWAADGITVTQIARNLNDQKMPTPSVYLSAIRGKYKTRSVWTYESVRNILANRIYTGDTVPFKSHVVQVGSNRVKPVPEELQEILPNTHDAIISRELFYQARKVIKSNKKSKASVQSNPFTSLLVCECCGNKLAKGKSSNKTWLCSTARYTQELGCERVRINDTLLHNIVLRAIVTQCKLLDVRIDKIRQAGRFVKSREQILRNEYQKMHREMERIRAEKMRLYEEYADCKIDKEAYLLKKSGMTLREESLKIQLSMSKEKLDAVEHQLQRSDSETNEAARYIRYQDITELTPALTKELIREIVVLRNGGIRIVWNFSDELDKLTELAHELKEASAV